MSEAIRGEFKGNPIITLQENENDKYPFTFGLKKARLIIAHMDAIRQFVSENVERR